MPHRTVRVLLVGGKPREARRLRERLAGDSPVVELVRATSVETGLRKLARGGIDLVLLDLPNTNGQRRALSRIHTQVPEIPILIVTPRADGATKWQEAVRSGAAAGVVARDAIDRETLARRLRRSLQGRSEEAGTQTPESTPLPLASGEADSRFQALFENLPVGLYRTTPGGRLLDVNPALVQLLGYPDRETLLTVDAADLYVDPGDRERWRETLERHGVVRNFETALRRYDGAVIWVEETTQAMRDGGGEVIYYEGAMKDITAQKAAVQALQESEERFRALVQNSSDMLLILAPDGTIRHQSPAGERIHGYRPEERIGRNALELVHPDDLEKARASLAGALARPEEPLELVIRIQHRDGSWRWVEVTTTGYLDNPAIQGIVVNVRDVTERVQYEHALATSEERFRALVQNSSDLIAILDREGKILYDSPAVEKVLGFTSEERVGRSGYDLIHPEDQPKVRQMHSHILAHSGEVHRESVRVRHRDGSWRRTEITATNLLDNPTIGGIVVNIRDVTEKALAEEKLQESQRRLITLMSNLPGMAYRCRNDPQWTMEFVSDGCLPLTGYSPEGLLENAEVAYADLIHPEDRERVWEEVQEAVREKRPFELLYRIQTAQGEEKWVWERGVAIFSPAGELEALEGFITDITAQKAAEDALRESEGLYRTLIEQSSDPIYVFQDNRLKLVNAAWERLFGYSQEEVAAADFDFMAIVAPESQPTIRKRLERQTADMPVPGRYEFRGLTRDGRIVDLEVSVAKILWRGRPAVQGIYRDITARKGVERALRETKETLEALINASPLAINALDLEGRITMWNPAAERMFGWSREEVLGKPLPYVPEDRQEEFRTIRRWLLAGESFTGVEARRRRKDGTVIDIRISAAPVRDAEGHIVGSLAVIEDLRERKEAEETIRHLASLTEQTPNPVIETDLEGRVTYLNQAAQETFPDLEVGSTGHPLLMGLEDLIPRFRLGEQDYVFREVGFGGSTFEESIFYLPESHLVRLFAHDITDRKEAEERLLFDAFHSRLTGLPNRALLTSRLEDVLRRAQRKKGQLFALLFLDIDRFKMINDSFGHAVGDQLLQVTGQRLQATLRATDMVAHLGGDEFAVLLEQIDHEGDALRTAGRLLERLSAPVELASSELFPTASLGVVLSSAQYQKPEEILRDAEIAMYRAKAQGRGRYELFDPVMHRHTLDRLRLETDLRRAMDRDEFRIHYQPLISLANGSVVGFEALVRWNHPEQGLIFPGQFIPVAEETGLIVPLGNWIFREACRQASAWAREFPNGPPLLVTINLSSRQFSRENLAEEIEKILAETGLEPGQLQLEITESLIMETAELASEVLTNLRSLGVSISLDDFGTGYSSLSYLHRFPLDALKIDRSFITTLGTTKENLEIVRTIVQLAHTLGMKAVAEGIETRDQLSILRRLKCDHGQGFLFAQPLAVPAATEFLRQRRSVDLDDTSSLLRPPDVKPRRQDRKKHA